MAGLIDFGITQPGSANAFAAGFNQAEQNRNALLQQQQQRQMADIQLKNALREQAQAESESQAWQAGAGNPQAVLQELQQRGLGRQAMALQTQITKSQADKLSTLKTQTELLGHTATQIMANPTLGNAIAATQQFGSQTGADVTNDIKELQALGDNPDAIKQWAAGHALKANELLPKFQHFDRGGAVVTGTVDPLTAKFVEGQEFKKGATPGELLAHQDRAARLNWEKANPNYEIKDTDSGLVAVNKLNPTDVKPVTMGGVQVQGTKGLTESQAKATGFASRAKAADKILTDLKFDPWVVASKQSVEGTIGGGPVAAGINAAMSPENQKADQAQRDFVNAVLRQESGAAISEAEFENARKQYFSQPGDKPAAIQQKAANRANAIKSLETIAGPGLKKSSASKVVDFGSLQ